jgi:hypothetical protein
MNLKSLVEIKENMTDNPCDTCREDCLGGIIYGNCEHFRSWYKDHNFIESCFNSLLYVQQSVECQSRGK